MEGCAYFTGRDRGPELKLRGYKKYKGNRDLFQETRACVRSCRGRGRKGGLGPLGGGGGGQSGTLRVWLMPLHPAAPSPLPQHLPGDERSTSQAGATSGPSCLSQGLSFLICKQRP